MSSLDGKYQSSYTLPRQNTMLTIIFGAGASYDSDPDFPSTIKRSSIDTDRPPLARDLFSRSYGHIAQDYKAAHALFPRLRAAENIEQELENISKRADSYGRTHRQLRDIRGYIRQVIEQAQYDWTRSYTHGITTYNSMLDTVDIWRERMKKDVSLITFNYDTLLDLACAEVIQMTFPVIDSYIENPHHFRLFKAHGSTDWLRTAYSENSSLENAGKLSWTGDFFAQSQDKPQLHNKWYLPAIAVPTTTKSEYEFPQSHHIAMKEAIKHTTSLIIVGWRGAEKHFLADWKENSDQVSLRHVFIVSDDVDKAKTVHQKLQQDADLSCADVRYSDSGFSGFVTRELEDFLKEVSQ